MIEPLQKALDDLAREHRDWREHLFEIKIDSYEANKLILSGRVLEAANLNEIRQALAQLAPSILVDDTSVEVLRRSEPRLMQVATNLTGLQRGPGWLTEQISQLLFGVQVEVLEEKERWAYVRCSDGYLGWAYLPYLRSEPTLPATHLVSVPLAELRAGPRAGTDLLSRVYGGTFVHMCSVQGEWAQIEAHVRGWMPLTGLRDLQSLPRTAADRRAQMARDAFTLMGVPYLWGGTSVNGIDCSGFAQLVHRWSGMTIRRDADMQMSDGKPVAPETMQPGDLAFFTEHGKEPAVTHVGISLGGWRMIHSSRSRNGVYVDDIQQVGHLRDNFIGAAAYLDS